MKLVLFLLGIGLVGVGFGGEIQNEFVETITLIIGGFMLGLWHNLITEAK